MVFCKNVHLNGLFISISIFILCFSSLNCAFATDTHTDARTQSFEVVLGATRIIYGHDSKGEMLSVSNTQDYPILVQSKMFGEDKVQAAPFFVSPPLFRLDGQQKSRIRILRTGGKFPMDRETLQWLCVTGVPPEEDDIWASDKDVNSINSKSLRLNIKVNVSNCIKVFFRPSNLKGEASDFASSLEWKAKDGQLTVKNPTPFYINFSSLKVGSAMVENIEYLKPFSSKNFILPKGEAGNVQWTLINDFGGVSKQFQSSLH